MSPSEAGALVVSILAGLAAVISAVATAMMAFRLARDMGHVRRDVNGRMDQLLSEQEFRVRAQEQLRQYYPPPDVGIQSGPGLRPDPIIRQVPPPNPESEGK